MKTCPFCGNEINENAVMCIKCGADLTIANNTTNSNNKKHLSTLKTGLILIIITYVISIVMGFASGFISGLGIHIDYAIFSTIYTLLNTVLSVVQIVGIVLSFVSYSKLKNN